MGNINYCKYSTNEEGEVNLQRKKCFNDDVMDINSLSFSIKGNESVSLV